jgi:isoquinoline 1-oxidoreductase subunit alpha
MISFILNGQPQQLALDPEMPLLWVLRDELGLKGTKLGCGMALCGACTVHMNGAPVRACSLPLAAVAGAQIHTIEGQQSPAFLALQQAWRELNVVQCGYCQSGQLMAATALLSSQPKPSDAHIDSAMGGNLCRCATYGRIRAAIHLAAQRLAEERT